MDNIAPTFSRIDGSFDGSNTNGYDLVIQGNERSYAYSVFDHVNNRFIALESYDISLPILVSKNQWLKNTFRSAHFIVENNRSTLIPALLFEESEKETYFNFSQEAIEGEKIRIDRIDRIGAVNIFGVSEILQEEISSLLPGVNVCHISSFLIETLWMNFKNLVAEKKIFVFVRQADLNMLVFDNKQLVYSNAFHVRAPEDVVYFVIFVMEQLNLNPEEIPVTLLGNINRDSPEFDLLFRYIRNLDFAPRNEDLQLSHVFRDVPDHAWYSLLNPILCRS